MQELIKKFINFIELIEFGCKVLKYSAKFLLYFLEDSPQD